MNWREAPLIRPLLFLILGILLGSYYPLLSPFVNFSLLLLFGLFFLYLQNNRLNLSAQKYFGVFISILFLILGNGLASISQAKFNPTHILNQSGNQLTVLAKILDKPRLKTKAQVKVQLISNIEAHSESKLEGRLTVFLPISEESKALQYGDVVYLNMKTSLIQGSKNPYSFDFKKYNANQGIFHQANISNWRLVEKSHGYYQSILSHRAHLLDILKKHLPTENEFAVGAALCLGSKTYLSTELKNEYANTGAMHVLAVSGLHVGIVFGFVFLVLSVFKTRKPYWIIAKIILTIISIWIYALLTGGTASVLRAALMFSFITVAMYLRSYTNIYNTLAAAAFCLLVYNPNLIFDVGFQLSFTAVAGIVYLQSRIYALLHFDWLAFDYIWKMTSVGIAAQIATFPIGLYYFHHFPVSFLLTGFFVVPFAYFILTIGILLFITEFVSISLAFFVGKLLYGLIWMNNALIHLISELPINHLGSIFIGGLGLLSIYLFLFLLDQYLKSAHSKFVIILAGLLFIVLSTSFYSLSIRGPKGYICVYHIPKKQLIDAALGKALFTIHSSDLKTNTLQYASENLRTYHGLVGHHNKSNLIEAHEQIVLLGGKRLGIVNQPKLPAKKMDLDFLVLSENVDLSMQKIVTSFDFDKLIFDSSNDKESVGAWKLQCSSLGISYHDVNTEGAFYEVF